MESSGLGDFKQILYILGAVVFVIYNIAKAFAKQQKAQTQREQAKPELSSEEQPQVRAKFERVQKSQFTKNKGLNNSQLNKNLSSSNPQSSQADLAKNEQPQPQNDSQPNELLKDFDLRQAVLYSEILKPKFHDQEGK